MPAGQSQKQKLQGFQQTVWSLPTAGITKTLPPTTEGVPATVDVSTNTDTSYSKYTEIYGKFSKNLFKKTKTFGPDRLCWSNIYRKIRSPIAV